VDEMNRLVVENAGQIVPGLRPVLDRVTVLAQRVVVVVLRLEDGVPIVPAGSDLAPLLCPYRPVSITAREGQQSGPLSM